MKRDGKRSRSLTFAREPREPWIVSRKTTLTRVRRGRVLWFPIGGVTTLDVYIWIAGVGWCGVCKCCPDTLFGFQGQQIIAAPLVMLLSVPILIQIYLDAGTGYWLSRHLGVAWCVAGPAALIGASNFFKLAVAAAISLFGLNSGAALAIVVGVLVEVPVMLSVVKIVKTTRPWYESGSPDAIVARPAD